MTCQFADKCWRYAYSKYLLEQGWSGEAPERYALVMLGYATIEMTERTTGRSLFAEQFPHVQEGAKTNLCPAINGQRCDECHEHQKEAQRLKRLELGRKGKRFPFPDGNARTWIPKATRKQVTQRDHYRCVYCNVAVGQYRNGERVKCVVDHYIPLKRGGHPTDEANLVLACHDCNDKKRAAIWDRGCMIGKY